MANRVIQKIPIDSKALKETLQKKGISIRQLGQEPVIDRSENTIRRYLAASEMPTELYKRIVEFINMEEQNVSFDI